MTRPFTNAQHSLIDGPPAEYRQDMSLFDYAIREAKAAASIAAKRAEIERQRDETLAIAHDTEEYRAVEAAKAELAASRKSAIDRDASVTEAKEAAKIARKALRGVLAWRTAKALAKDARSLRAAEAETEKRAVVAMQTGKRPGMIEARPS